MNEEFLKKGNELLKQIREHESALVCFEYDENEEANYYREECRKLAPNMISTNPKLIIEYDKYDEDIPYREMLSLPMVLSGFLVNIIKEQIKENLNKLQKEFDDL